MPALQTAVKALYEIVEEEQKTLEARKELSEIERAIYEGKLRCLCDIKELLSTEDQDNNPHPPQGVSSV